MGFFETRSKAQAALIAGIIYVDGKKVTKAGAMVAPDSNVEVSGEKLPYVSRGGLKLEEALKKFRVEVKEKVAVDVGASTGGFTDCLLKFGAKKVYAVDVGYGQLAWELRNDPRVKVVERTNARYLRPEDLYKDDEKATLATVDISFISLSKVFQTVYNLLSDEGEVIALVKPQFEAGRDQVEKGGLVRDPRVHEQVLENVMGAAVRAGFEVKGKIRSPITGADGNIEFFIHLGKLKS